jgi:hypothetical protein
MNVRLLPAAGALLLASLPALGQGTLLDFPLEARSFDTFEQVIRMEPKDGAIASLTAAPAQLTFVGVPIPDGRLVDLQVTRIELASMYPGFFVNGQSVPELLDPLALSVWTGAVVGEASSEVTLSFSEYGSRGWVKSNGSLFHLMPQPSADGDWSNGSAVFVDEATLQTYGLTAKATCGIDDMPKPAGVAPAPAPVPAPPGGVHAFGNTLYALTVAVDCDYQLFQLFGGDLSAETAYATTLMAWVAMRFEDQVNVRMSFPHLQFWTVAADPWATPDDPENNDCVDLTFEVQSQWQFNVPAGADIGHVISGAALGCGAAWTPGACNAPYNFSSSSQLNGLTTFPVTQDPDNWDFATIAHQLGHNLDAPHTNSYCPPIDECEPTSFGPCQSQQNCTSQGTLMSSCHLCPGGYANNSTYFHDQSAYDMRVWLESNCLPVVCGEPVTYCTSKTNSEGCLPSIGTSGSPTLGGTDNFHVSTVNMINNKQGLFFWSFNPVSKPFQGGTKCVMTPTARTLPSNSGGNPPPNDCSGVLTYHWSKAYMQSKGLSAGTDIYVQTWGRDPTATFTTSLSNAVHFTICN